MIQTKYLIIIGAIICLLILYYFHDEISNVKKLFLPTYQKTMALEARVMDLEKNLVGSKKKSQKIVDSPALSITYQSDMVKNGNLSVKYADVNDTEADELLRQINKPQVMQQQLPQQRQVLQQQIAPTPANNAKKTFNVQNGELSDFTPIPNNEQNKIGKNADIYNEYSDTINFRISDLINKNETTETQIQNKSDVAEYQKILSGLGSNIRSESAIADTDAELDEDVIRSISESLHYIEMPSDTVLSEIPATKKKAKTKPAKADKAVAKRTKKETQKSRASRR